MKKLFVCALFFFGSYSLHAQQTANVISYQGLIQGINGASVTDSTYPVSVSIWTDATAGTELWQDVFQTSVKGGIFNIMLGSQIPLPTLSQMDKPLWVSVNVGGSSVLASRSRLSAVPMALNVADSSITAAKMGTDYISSVSVNGEKITSRGANLDIVANEGLMVSFQRDSNRLVLSGTAGNGQPPPVANDDGGTDWSQIGNSSTNPDTDYLGTSDSIPFEIHVNNHGDTTTAGNGRVVRYEPKPKSPNIIGGYHGNVVNSTDGGDVIAGGGWSTYPNTINGDFAVVGGGANNKAYDAGTVAGGGLNTAGEEGFVGGGAEDSAGYLSVVAGGLTNIARYYGSVVTGGVLNKALDTAATVSGGTGNTANALNSTVGGGITNLASGYASTVSGGHQNGATGVYSSVGGGFLNFADTLSAIPGGSNLTLSKNSFGFNSGGTAYVFDTNVAFLGNVDLWLTNLDNTPRQLRFFGPNVVDYYGDASGYTSFQYNGGAIIHYILPGAQGSLGQVLTNDGTGQLSWGPGVGAGAWSISGNAGTSAPPDFLGTLDSNSLELHVFDTGSSNYGDKRVMRYEVNDTSANLIGGFHDNAIIGSHLVGVVIAGGGAKGHLNIAKGSYSTISGGRENTDTNYSFVGGGDSNRALGSYSVVVGGTHNLNQGDSAVIVGGTSNQIIKTYTFVNERGTPDTLPGGTNCIIGAGSGNKIGNFGIDSTTDQTFSSAIVAGDSNRVSEEASIIGAGFGNVIEDDDAFIGAGIFDTITRGLDAAIVAGIRNWTAANLSFIGAGFNNRDSASESFIGAGENNSTSGSQSFLGSGYNNHITTHVGSLSSDPAGDQAGILAGEGLITQSYAQTALGFYNIPQGESVNHFTFHPNDRILIIGSGKDSTARGIDTIIRRNAFEVSNSGHSIVYHTNGSGGATPPPPGPPSPPSGAIYGARYQDNTCYAWGDTKGVPITPPCSGTMNTNSDFGVDSVVYICKGQYRVFLNTVDPYSGNQVSFSHGFSVTATSVTIIAGVPTTLLQVTPLGFGAANSFDIFLGNTTGSPVDGEVMFHVFGRQ